MGRKKKESPLSKLIEKKDKPVDPEETVEPVEPVEPVEMEEVEPEPEPEPLHQRVLRQMTANTDTDTDKPKRWVLKPKTSICGTRKGILGPGEEVTADILTNGQETLDSLIERGLVVEK